MSAAQTHPAGGPALGQAFALDAAIDRIAHWLPGQGPLKDFVHHNPLHAVQSLPFHQGVAVAARVYGARGYLPVAEYQALYRQGKISGPALEWALAATGLAAQPRAELRRLLFEHGHDERPPVSLAKHGLRAHWLNHLQTDLNAAVHPLMFRLLAGFLDQGISRWPLARPDERFWECVRRLATDSWLPLYPFGSAPMRRLLGRPADEVALHCLERLVGDSRLYPQYLLELLLSHPGWSGMVRFVESNPGALLEPRLISLREMLAVELAVELAMVGKARGGRFATVAEVAAGTDGIPRLGEHEAGAQVSAQVPAQVPRVPKVWHEALERTLHAQLWTALAAQPPPQPAPQPLLAQALFCIDDRECSLRRHLEHALPGVETLGAAGFFGIDFFYQSFDDAYPVAQCPTSLTPRHLVKEGAAAARPNLAQGLSTLHLKPHSLFQDWLYTQLFGLAYAGKMLWEVFRPGSQLLAIGELSAVDAHSRLHLLRQDDTVTEDGHLLGFSVPEMADRIGGLLRNIGLTGGFAPLVVVIAHGSSSTNNPHFAAYDCGACSGKPGAPNARAFAWMANHPPVRALLRQRGIDLPDGTHFVAALHDTSRDEIRYFEEDACPPTHSGALAAFQAAMAAALSKNALERCRSFELAPKPLTEESASRHVKQRASSIFEPRPELNHSNNLYCVIGRRSLTRALFLDRRAFLHSYPPDTDADGAILANILAALIPVCGGINLEYLFSRIDNTVYGAGSKSPHNVIGLLGVANGVEGDLRTGLPQQMVEAHEPARLLFVVEQTPHICGLALARLAPALKGWLDNEWVRLSACHPHSRASWLYQNGLWQATDAGDGAPPDPNPDSNPGSDGPRAAGGGA